MYITKTLPSYVIQLCVICHMLPDHVQNADVSNAVYLRFLTLSFKFCSRRNLSLECRR